MLQIRDMAPSIVLYLNALAKTIKAISLVCGDMNLVVDPKLDSTSSKRARPFSLANLMLKEDIYNVWRCLHAS